MAITLKTYAGQTVTPQDDSIVYEAALGSGGIFYGGTTTIASSNTLHVAAGHGVICGRKFTIDETDITVQLASSSTNLLGRLYIHLDLSNTTAPIQLMTETGATLTPPVMDENVNITNGVYEINLATFVVSTSTISDLVNVFPKLGSSGTVECTLTTNGWTLNNSTSEYEQTCYSTSIFESSRPTQGIIYPSPCSTAQRKAIQKAAALIVGMVTADGSVKFRATAAPTTQITIGLGV